MEKIKRVFKKLIPPFFFDLLQKFKSTPVTNELIVWSGPFDNWEKVVKDFGGYDQQEILEKCKNSLLKVKKGEAAYERDSVLFEQVQYCWPLLASLQKAALDNNGKLSVLDFGGSLGSSYFQNRTFLSGVKNLFWSVVEQGHFVDCGKELFQNSELNFYHSIDSCLEENKIDVLLLSSVLQYLDDPFKFSESILKYKFKYIVIDRTTFTELSESKIMVQSVPESIYPAAYPCWFISETSLMTIFADHYSVVSDFESICDGPPQVFNGIKVSWKGLLLETKS